ncbi:hypothetical protein Pyn_01513 [Prunus yedoensis var. nudiflora]|uniref:Uncharacterized protein n=1 Tax=Prunus yedoensis var. nudiflora TaxID=2094558 RepID=A0A314YZZ2_PRUYE|nr:hypothetical protein Pyn_01513 [Prunus yedoensis var. nudiflora]
MLEPLAIAQSRNGLSSSSLLCCLHRCQVHNSKLITSCGQAGIDRRAIQPAGSCFRPEPLLQGHYFNGTGLVLLALVSMHCSVRREDHHYQARGGRLQF